MSLRVLDLFSGVGGFSLGLEACGMETVAFCERDPYASAVLRHWWPGVPVFSDVTRLSARALAARGVPAPDLICGGFPCQPYSVAGPQMGENDERHLWPEFARLVAELRPRWVLGENVPGIRGIAADAVLADLEASGYACWPLVVGAAHAAAPHPRQRVWFLACRLSDADSARLEVGRSSDTGGARPHRGADAVRVGWWTTEPDVGRVVAGIPYRVDRLRCLGNAVVPAVVAMIGRTILRLEALRRADDAGSVDGQPLRGERGADGVEPFVAAEAVRKGAIGPEQREALGPVVAAGDVADSVGGDDAMCHGGSLALCNEAVNRETII
ncbi:DNA cytosine methyltransferase [Elioraea sp.]|uniref:DNA cytosine methyltransferase n=1 Tax=Elioraea sp. TaxID=2185103 RepID=UPI0025C17D2D|nr:DNA cytosine methyltransferase [Elioraea sp.]